jgi:hypothetical protein
MYAGTCRRRLRQNYRFWIERGHTDLSRKSGFDRTRNAYDPTYMKYMLMRTAESKPRDIRLSVYLSVCLRH